MRVDVSFGYGPAPMALRSHRSWRLLALACLLAAGVVLGLASVAFALSAAPALLLAAALVCGAFPGEQLLERLRSRRSTPRRARPVALVARGLAPWGRPVGLEAAYALAVRPPPFAAPLAR